MKQLEARELRIGNYVEYKGWYRGTDESDKIFNVKSISEEELRLTDGKITTIVNCSDVSPIPLTEEWFKAFGFALDEIGYVAKNENEVYTFVDRNERGFMLVVADIEVKETYIKHVQQLQNLYYSLTGEELTIKE